MFFPFTSDKPYPEPLWYDVWQAEVWIQTVIMDEGPALKAYPREELRDKLNEDLKLLAGEIPWIGEHGPWVRKVIDRELDSIHAFVQREALVFPPYASVKPDAVMLQKCFSESQAFSDMIKASAEELREQMESWKPRRDAEENP
jgi:hypothetical protein